MELEYCVGVQSSTTVWAPGTGPLPTKTQNKMGRRPLDCGAGRVPHRSVCKRWPIPQSAPMADGELARGKPCGAVLAFGGLRVRAAHRDEKRKTLREQEWLLIEWPSGEAEPTKYWLATLPADTPLVELVRIAKMRSRIERDYQELKQEFGLSHYEGRNWRGFHRRATLCIAAYAFLLADRLKHGGSKKNSAQSKTPV